MLKRGLYLFVVLIFMLTVVGISQAQEAKPAETKPAEAKPAETKPDVVKGEVQEIAEDGSYIVVDNQKILTSPQLVEEQYVEVGDLVEVTTEKTEQGLQAKGIEYVFEEDVESEDVEE